MCYQHQRIDLYLSIKVGLKTEFYTLHSVVWTSLRFISSLGHMWCGAALLGFSYVLIGKESVWTRTVQVCWFTDVHFCFVVALWRVMFGAVAIMLCFFRCDARLLLLSPCKLCYVYASYRPIYCPGGSGVAQSAESITPAFYSSTCQPWIHHIHLTESLL